MRPSKRGLPRPRPIHRPDPAGAHPSDDIGGDPFTQLTRLALEAGFRAIDTANQRKHYFEAGVGGAVRTAVAEMVGKQAEAGIDVICDKPMANSLAEAIAIENARLFREREERKLQQAEWQVRFANARGHSVEPSRSGRALPARAALACAGGDSMINSGGPSPPR